mmetsp:Transcript_29263/g.99520  ORF Transcript_29263/g.99520 Transcript_29263/m.99520 type:complete len:213 (-) Transcript_29263:108-746(-)
MVRREPAFATACSRDSRQVWPGARQRSFVLKAPLPLCASGQRQSCLRAMQLAVLGPEKRPPDVFSRFLQMHACLTSSARQALGPALAQTQAWPFVARQDLGPAKKQPASASHAQSCFVARHAAGFFVATQAQSCFSARQVAMPLWRQLQACFLALQSRWPSKRHEQSCASARHAAVDLPATKRLAALVAQTHAWPPPTTRQATVPWKVCRSW